MSTSPCPELNKNVDTALVQEKTHYVKFCIVVAKFSLLRKKGNDYWNSEWQKELCSVPDLTSFLIDYGSILVLVYPNTTRHSHFTVSHNNYTFIGYTFSAYCTWIHDTHTEFMLQLQRCEFVELDKSRSQVSGSHRALRCRQAPFLLKNSPGCATLVSVHMHSSERQNHKFFYSSKFFHLFLPRVHLHVRGDTCTWETFFSTRFCILRSWFRREGVGLRQPVT